MYIQKSQEILLLLFIKIAIIATLDKKLEKEQIKLDRLNELKKGLLQ
ncbi:hypothetical protein [Clostridium novyi]|nr:hypothetical protein [Clostridium novyi]